MPWTTGMIIQMSDLLTHNIHDSNDLVKWVVSHLISSNKDLSYSINMGDGGACSAFVAQDNNDNILYARNYDYLQSAKNVLMHTYSKDGYEAIAMALAVGLISTVLIFPITRC